MTKNTDPAIVVMPAKTYQRLLDHLENYPHTRDEMIRDIRKINDNDLARIPTSGFVEMEHAKQRKVHYREARKRVGQTMYMELTNNRYRPYVVTKVHEGDHTGALFTIQIEYERSPLFHCSTRDRDRFVEQIIGPLPTREELPERAVILDRHTDRDWRDARTQIGIELNCAQYESYLFSQPYTKIDAMRRRGGISVNPQQTVVLHWAELREMFPDIVDVELIVDPPIVAAAFRQVFVPKISYDTTRKRLTVHYQSNPGPRDNRIDYSDDHPIRKSFPNLHLLGTSVPNTGFRYERVIPDQMEYCHDPQPSSVPHYPDAAD